MSCPGQVWTASGCCGTVLLHDLGLARFQCTCQLVCSAMRGPDFANMLAGNAVRELPEQGVYVHGLWLDGARRIRKAGSLVESESKKLFAALPVLWITSMRQSLLGSKRDVYSPAVIPPCMAPVYRYPTRTDRYLVVSIPLPTKTDKPDHWTLRGAAVLCITQQRVVRREMLTGGILYVYCVNFE